MNNRIYEAKIVNPNDQPRNEIRFGANITLKTEGSENIQTFQIVGVDEADISRGKISFISPIAKVLINKTPGDIVTLKRANGDTVFEIMGIAYNEA